MAITALNDTVTAEPPGSAREAAFEHALQVLKERRDEFNEQRYVPKDFIALLKKAGIYRASTPERFGGEPMPPADFMKLIERISEVDPATGWVASFGSALNYFGALPLDTQEKIYANGPDLVYAGGLFPMQEAEKVEGGYLCSGEWQFASGCKGADILSIGLRGGPETQGRPLGAILNPADAEIIDAWDVAGMQATGSHVVKVDNLFIPEEHTFIRGGESHIDEPLNRYPATAYAAQVLAVVTLGAARAALDFVTTKGSASTSITGGEAKGNRPVYKIGLAHAEADLRSARSFFYEITEEVWEKAVAGEEITDRDTALVRLAASQAAKVGRKAILDAYDLAGTGAIFNSHPLQRYARDGLVPRQHAMLQENTFEAAGAVLLNLAPGIPSFP